MEQWQKVFSSTDFFQAELLKQLLVANDIEAVLLNKKDSSYQFGEAQVLVAESDRERAEALILQNNLNT